MVILSGEMGTAENCNCRGLDEERSFDSSTLFLQTAAWLPIQKNQMNHKTKPEEEKKTPNLLGHFQ